MGERRKIKVGDYIGKVDGNKRMVSYMFTIIEFLNRENFKELDGKSDEYTKGFMKAIDSLRELLLHDCD
jgi:hypothetical protein